MKMLRIAGPQGSADQICREPPPHTRQGDQTDRRTDGEGGLVRVWRRDAAVLRGR